MEREEGLAAAFAGNAHARIRKGEDDQSKENEDEEEVSRRQPRAMGAGEGRREGERDGSEGEQLGAS